eukprot:TRINITY_DN7904_c0_g1_i1.p1 TRINITY_DN7904_c0_g1~~TRINITY_DN7904_c0_g1_i1.p1  ORF type:complete len:264 (+),score=50.26 TRINITY_DN7904_c0_g1_i1:198-989(+)
MAATAQSVAHLSTVFAGQKQLSSVARTGFSACNGSRVLAMATKRISAKPPAADKAGPQTWLPGVKVPFLTEPEWLDRSLPGDFGFDPLGLGKDPAALKWYREAELIHGRLAMLAVIGIFVGEAFTGIPWFEAGAAPGALSPFSFGSLLGTQLLLTGWVETKRGVDYFNPGTQALEWGFPWFDAGSTAENFASATGQQGYPGGRFFDPLGLAGSISGGQYTPDSSKLATLQKAEIKHARLAMVAMLIFYFEAGQGNTPLGALGL